MASMSALMEVSRSAAADDRREHPMRSSFGLYRDLAWKDGTTSSTVPASHPFDHDCKPEGVLSYRHLEVGTNGNVIVVRLGKHWVLDELTVNKISDELLGVADRPDCHHLLLDFSGVAKLSSAMLAKLLKLRRKMEPKGENLRLSGLNSQLRSVFATTRLDCLFDITDATNSPPFPEEAI
jgi:anti-sigma B factor antagonist